MRKILTLVLALAFVPSILCAQDDNGMPPMPGVVTFQANLSPLEEVPPVTGLDVSGTGMVMIHMERDPMGDPMSAVVQFRVNLAFLSGPETVTNMHIHRGPAGTAGPVVIGSMFGESVEVDGTARIFREVEVTDSAGLSVIGEIMETPEQFYLNVHSVSNPPGIVRGQLMPPPTVGQDIAMMAMDLEEIRSNTDQIPNIQEQLDRMEGMLRQIARLLGLAPQ